MIPLQLSLQSGLLRFSRSRLNPPMAVSSMQSPQIYKHPEQQRQGSRQAKTGEENGTGSFFFGEGESSATAGTKWQRHMFHKGNAGFFLESLCSFCSIHLCKVVTEVREASLQLKESPFESPSSYEDLGYS